MKKNLITILILTISHYVFCDTLDYWHVYYNDSTIAQYNSNVSDTKIEIEKSRLKENDLLTIRYGDDTPCNNCKFYLFVQNEEKKKFRIVETNELWGKLSINLFELSEFGKTNRNNKFEFYYWEKDNKARKRHDRLVLRLTII